MDQLVISFPNASYAEQGMLATDLNDELRSIRHIEHRIERARQDTQDAGTLVAVVLGAPAVSALVKGLFGWMARSNQASLTLDLPDGTKLSLNRANSEDLPKAIEALSKIAR
ncbi:hypothetical protein ACC668_02695 [Rhizobium ruizarguesonis]